MKKCMSARLQLLRMFAVTWIVAIPLLLNNAWGLSISSYKEDADGITCTCNTGVMKVKICKDDIVRVAYSTNPTIPERTFKIVTNTWTPQTAFTKTESGDNIILQTSKIKVKVNKTNATVTFTDLSDVTILSEYDKTLTPATREGVSTYTVKAEWNSPADEGLYGFGQHQDRKVNYKGQTEYLEQRYAVATAIPVWVSTKGYGIFWDNYSYSDYDGRVSGNTRYSMTSRCSDIKGPILDYYFFYGPEIDQVIAGYRTATGHAPLFPKWAYGLIQSKDRYNSQNDLFSVMDGYRNNKIPLDCIVQDWHYWDGAPNGKQGCYCFNPSYGDYKTTIKKFREKNIHTIVSIWSQLEQGSPPFNDFNTKGWLWPINGGCAAPTHFVDAYNTEGREAFWKLIQGAMFDTAKIGFDGWWLDNDEPFPYPCNFALDQIQTAMGKGVLFHNTYTFPFTEMGYKNWRRDNPGRRCVILHRANFAGQQAHSTMQWSNDINCTFEVLTTQIPCGLNSTLSGIPYWCSDIGGYWGSNGVNWSTPDNRELMTRWLQYGSFCPVFRIHGNGPSKEIYQTCWDATTKANLIATDRLHYRLMPYVYSLAWMTTNSGYTPMRHLIFDYRTDSKVKDIGNQFMYGPAFMVSPVTAKGQTSRSVYLPAGKWYDFWTGESVNGGSSITADAPLSIIPLHIRAGSIIPMGPEIQHANERADSIELRIYPGKDGEFTMYEDEGDNYGYEQGKYGTIKITYNDNAKSVTIGKRNGSFPGMDSKKIFNIVYVKSNHGVGGTHTAQPDTQIVWDGTSVGIIPNHIQKTMLLQPRVTMRTVGNQIVLPAEFSGKMKTVSVFNCSGKLLSKMVVKKNAFNVRKDLGLPTGTYIVKARVIE